MPRTSTRRTFKILFHSHGKLYELYARQVSQSSMYGFIEVAELIYGERSAVLVDPAEERLKAEFSGVRRTYIPMHSVLRVDEVEQEGVNKVTSIGEGDKVTPFPVPGYPPPGGPARD
jgi:hypothetical protein